MTQEDSKKRAENKCVKFVKDRICNKDGDKPYVFISYKSDDWEVVLADAVYRLVKDHGLNIYFDGSFDLHNSLWIEQFRKNMESGNCKGVLVFLNNKYAASYATLLELMYSQTYSAASNDVGLPVVTVNLEPLKELDDNAKKVNTGLGVQINDNGERNINADEEKEVFDEAFSEMIDCKKLIPNAQYVYKKKELDRGMCSWLVRELIKTKKVNENYYEKGGSLNNIVSSIRDACGNEVFSPKPSPSKPVNSDITEDTTLKEFFIMCESPEVCLALRDARENAKKQFFDYMMAALLRGCDEKSFKLSKGSEEILIPAKWNYCTYAVSRNFAPENPKCGSSQFTWTSNSRKAVGIDGSGTLGDNSVIFAGLSETETLGTIRQKFIEGKDKGFITKNNQQVLAAFDELFAIKIEKGEK